MRKLVVFALSICLFAGLLTVPVMAAEMRGLWVDAYHPGFRTPEQTDAMIAKAKACNFNAIFVQVRRRGDVYYKSAIEPMADDAAAGYDPLADIVAKAHAAGLEVHAWLTAFEVRHDHVWSKSKASVHKVHPEWLMKDNLGSTKFRGNKLLLDPGVPEVQKYLVDIVEEVVKNYAVDGIHLDIAKYPGRYAGYNDISVKRFNQAKGRNGTPDNDDEDWCAWRRAQVTQYVESAYRAATRGKPGVKVSAAVFPNVEDSRENLFQDWVGWLKSGILDFAVPMVFPNDNRVFEPLATQMVAAGDGLPICIGLGAYKARVSDSLEQARVARQIGAGGVVVYNYYYCNRVPKGESVSFMDALRSGPFAQPEGAPAPSRR